MSQSKIPKSVWPFEQLSRRNLLKLGLGAGVVGPLSLTATAKPLLTSAPNILILGAGAGGLSMANRLRRMLPKAKITLVDTREEHFYQPGWTLVASGVWPQAKTQTKVMDWLPKGINWVKGQVAEYNPEANQVLLTDGQILLYDQLIIATGLQLRYDLIEGMDINLIGRGKGVGSVYASLDAAAATNKEIEQFIQRGGTGLFNLPPTALKCAGAPIKMTFTTLDRLERSGQRSQYNIEFMTPSGSLFGVPFYNDFIKKRFGEQGVIRNDFWTLKALDPEAKQAVYSVRDGEDVVKNYDFIHVVPPMDAGEPMKNSPLAFKAGESFTGWMKVDRETLQNTDYPNVWGIGDVMGMPSNKTAASVKMQARILEENLLSSLQGKPLLAKHNGYTSCPLITGIGKAMLVEFGWDSKLLPSFSFIDPKQESWTVWVMKERMLRPAYYAMLEGRI